MNTNGHVSTDDINRIMDEWDEVTNGIKMRLRDSFLTDLQSDEERELDILTTVIIPGSFQFGGGSVPELIQESDAHYLWDCSRFSNIISEHARESNKTTREFLEAAFKPRFKDRPKDTPIEALKRLILFSDGRERMIKRILGEEELLRIKSEEMFKDGIQKLTKKHRPGSLKDQEEVKPPEVTQNAS